jgi:ribonuclease Z
MIELTFLGTSAMVPTAARNHSALFIKYKSEGILIDCGEGTQRQCKQFKIPLPKITKILISHWHGDHCLGLPGLLQTLSAEHPEKELIIYGPVGIKKHIKLMMEAFPFDCKLNLEVKEITTGIFIKNKDFTIEAHQLDHSVATIGFRFVEEDRRRINVKAAEKIGIPNGPLLGKLQRGTAVTFKGVKILPDDVTYIVIGKKIGIIPDTGKCKECIDIAKETDLLICEATFMKTEEDKAEQYKHLTAEQAAMIAQAAEAKKLIITHFSQRYKEKNAHGEEAKDVFPNTMMAFDGMQVKV